MERRLLCITLLLINSSLLIGQTIQGKIFNSSNGQPVSGAHVSSPNSVRVVVSDESGVFFFPIEGDNTLYLMISHLGFANTKVELTDSMKLESLNIKMHPTAIQLNKNIVVTASRNEMVSFQAPGAITVLTQQELDDNPSRSMAESLVGVTGVWMQKTNHGGGSPFVRGLTGNQTLLLVDGIRLNNATFRYGPNQYFNTLDIFSTERIEVIRGKGSVLYGSDALGGAVQVINRSPSFTLDKPHLSGRLKGQIINRGMERSALGELTYQSKQFAVLGNVGYKNFGDIYAGGNLGFLRPSGYDEISGNLNARIRLGDRWQLKTVFQYVEQQDVARYDQVAQRGYQEYTFDPQIHQLAYARLEHTTENALAQKISITLSHQQSDETRRIQTQTSSVRQKEHDVVKTLGLNLLLFSSFKTNWTATSGLEYYSDQVKSYKTRSDESSVLRGLYTDNSTMQNLALFSQHILKFDRLTLQFGGRLNSFWINALDEAFGNVTLNPTSLVGNISLQYKFSIQDQFILSTQSAFRAPNINDISSFGLFDYGIEIPSTNLAPEKTLTMEIGYKRTGDRFSMSVFAFNTRLKNQIVREAATYNGNEFIGEDRVYTKQNLARSNIHGFEFESGFQLNTYFSMINNLTWLYGKNLENDGPMRRIPPLHGKWSLRYRRDKLFLESEFLFASKQDRLSGGDIDDHRIPEGGTPGWAILNLKAGYTWKKVALRGGLQNLFNQAYRMHGSGVDGVGRSFWTSLEVKF